MNSRSLILIGLTTLSLSCVPGCKKDNPSSPDLATSGSSAPPTDSIQAPTSRVNKLDPQTLKNYRLDVCYYGALTLRQARDGYLASLGKDEPNEKKIPNFGFPLYSDKPQEPATPAASAKPSATPSAAPAGTAKPSATPSAAPAGTAKPSATPSAAPAGTAKPGAAPTGTAKAETAEGQGPFGSNPHAIPAPASASAQKRQIPTRERRAFEFNSRAPYERSARGCNSALQLNGPPMGDVDVALTAFTTFANELSKDITAASSYYLSEEYKKDKLQKGKELHKKLIDEFQRLDELHDKLGSAIDAWRKAHPADPSKQDEGEKLVSAAFGDASAVIASVLPKNKEGYAGKVEKLEKSVNALKEFASSHNEPWSKITVGPFDGFLRAVKEAKGMPSGLDAETYLDLVNSFSLLLDSRNRAHSRSLVVKARATMPHVPSSALPPGHPMPEFE